MPALSQEQSSQAGSFAAGEGRTSGVTEASPGLSCVATAGEASASGSHDRSMPGMPDEAYCSQGEREAGE